jgi:hypothetical protein
MYICYWLLVIGISVIGYPIIVIGYYSNLR